MTAYTAIADSEIDTDSPITESLLTRIRNNPIAITEGSTGAPKIQTAAYQAGSVDQAAIGAAAVGQGELKTTTASQSGAPAAGAAFTVTLTGGTYSWWNFQGTGRMFGWNGNSGAGVLDIYCSTIAATAVPAWYCYERYVQASPPYDMGDGEIELFVYAMLEKGTGVILGLSLAPDPTWAYHGPTDIRATGKNRNGKKTRTVKTIGTSGLTIAQARKNAPALLEEYLKGKQSLTSQEIEVTAAFKNSDMDTHSHPWINNGPEFFQNREVIMLDPFDPVIKTLTEIHSAEGATVARELIESRFSFDNQTKPRKGPKGIKFHGVKFK
jgi:hypothetical protein